MAGAPTEFFDATQMEMFKVAWGVATLDDYIRELFEKKTGPNGVFGFKVHFGQLVDAPGAERLAEFPNLRYIYMHRRDRLSQAISFAKATQTEQWASTHQSRRPPEFDFEQISEMLRWVRREELGWQRLFAEGSISPLRLAYEDLVDSTEASLGKVMRFLGIDAPEGFKVPEVTLRKQADDVSDAWFRRYTEIAGRDSAT